MPDLVTAKIRAKPPESGKLRFNKGGDDIASIVEVTYEKDSRHQGFTTRKRYYVQCGVEEHVLLDTDNISRRGDQPDKTGPKVIMYTLNAKKEYEDVIYQESEIVRSRFMNTPTADELISAECT